MIERDLYLNFYIIGLQTKEIDFINSLTYML